MFFAADLQTHKHPYTTLEACHCYLGRSASGFERSKIPALGRSRDRPDMSPEEAPAVDPSLDFSLFKIHSVWADFLVAAATRRRLFKIIQQLVVLGWSKHAACSLVWQKRHGSARE
jgi:hypothetical protein